MAEPFRHDDADASVEQAPLPAETAGEEQPPGRPRLLIFAMAALGLFAGYLVWQTLQLQQENTALQGSVQSLEGQVRAYQDHLAGARERTTDLRTQMESLEAFLAQEPAASD